MACCLHTNFALNIIPPPNSDQFRLQFGVDQRRNFVSENPNPLKTNHQIIEIPPAKPRKYFIAWVTSQEDTPGMTSGVGLFFPRRRVSWKDNYTLSFARSLNPFKAHHHHGWWQSSFCSPRAPAWPEHHPSPNKTMKWINGVSIV